MNYIDLSLSLSENTEVYPGDPTLEFKQIFHVKTDGWNMARFSMNTHDATHVNVPLHAKDNGKNLSDYNIEDFCGESILFESEEDIQTGIGLVFGKKNIHMNIAKKIVKFRPKFVALSAKFEFDLEVEKYLLENDIISFERLENTHLLPKKFFFYGIPLKIEKGDGSPIRAFAVI